jgi:hypothetical protein
LSVKFFISLIRFNFDFDIFKISAQKNFWNIRDLLYLSDDNSPSRKSPDTSLPIISLQPFIPYGLMRLNPEFWYYHLFPVGLFAYR